MTAPDIDRAKQAAREEVWTLLEREGAAPRGAHGHIPDFVGAGEAAARLAALDVWHQAQIIKANPDKAQLPVRVQALRESKLLYMAVPKLATPRPFYLLDVDELTVDFNIAASSRGAAKAATTVGVDQMRPVDLILCGSVAVNRNGVRVGKGAGYADIEVALLAEAGLLGSQTTIVTTVHQLQVINHDLPETTHDFSVDIIITPHEVIHCEPPRRPTGIIRSHLTPDKIRDIPLLRAIAS